MRQPRCRSRNTRYSTTRCNARVAGRSSAHVLLATRQGEPLQTIGRAALYRLHESGLATTIVAAAPVRDAVNILLE